MFPRFAVRALSVALLIVTIALASVRAGQRDRFTPFVPTPLPQRATGDLDGDGRPDIARIDNADAAARISVELSNSAHTSTLSAPVAALIEHDIDRDGDLDLLATTASGEMVVWINDGRGHFTRRLPSAPRTLTADSVVETARSHALVAVTNTPSPLPSIASRRESVVVTRIRPPTAPSIVARQLLLLCTLRAPPVLI